MCDYEAIVKLIARTTTAKGLKVTCRLDRRKYSTVRKVTDEHINRCLALEAVLGKTRRTEF